MAAREASRDRRRGLDPRVRGVARDAATRRCSTRSSDYNERGLPLDAAAARLAARAPRRGERQYGVEIPWRPLGEAKPSDAQLEASDGGGRAARARCSPACRTTRPSARPDEQSRWLLAQLLDYHRREAKPAWWEFFARFEKTDEELDRATPRRSAGSSRWRATSRCPRRARSTDLHARASRPGAQDRPGGYVDPLSAGRPETGELEPFSRPSSTSSACSTTQGSIEIRRATSQARRAAPARADPGRPTTTRRASARRCASSRADVVDRGPRRRRPATAPPGRSLRREPARAQPRSPRRAAAGGPPTSSARPRSPRARRQLPVRPGPARLGQDLHRRAADPAACSTRASGSGWPRTATRRSTTCCTRSRSCAGERGVDFRGLKKAAPDGDSAFESEARRAADRELDERRRLPDRCRGRADRRHRLAVVPRGDARVGRLPGHRRGRPGLARRRARDGDRRPQPGPARRPAPARPGLPGRPPARRRRARCSSTCSATHGTIPPERGVFLDHTRRMHPDVCRFVSEAVYEGRLESFDGVRRPAHRRATAR